MSARDELAVMIEGSRRNAWAIQPRDASEAIIAAIKADASFATSLLREAGYDVRESTLFDGETDAWYAVSLNEAEHLQYPRDTTRALVVVRPDEKEAT